MLSSGACRVAMRSTTGINRSVRSYKCSAGGSLAARCSRMLHKVPVAANVVPRIADLRAPRNRLAHSRAAASAGSLPHEALLTVERINDAKDRHQNGIVRVATFNCENMFRRFEFNRVSTGRNNDDDGEPGFTLDQTHFKISNDKEKSLTAAAILAVNADVFALQEVESLDMLDFFNEEYLASTYKYRVLVQGNDKRGINVAVLSRYPFKAIHTARFAAVGDNGVADDVYKEQERVAGRDVVYVFSRDCLRVDVAVPGEKPLCLYVNHFKSMMGGRNATKQKRKEQAERVAAMLARDHGGASLGEDYVIVCGDFNDLDQDDSGTVALIRNLYLENVLRRLPEKERWTHFFSKENSYSQLDYLLLSPALSQATNGVMPLVERRGQPKRARRYTGPWFESVDVDRPKASDHCPVAIDIQF